MKADNLVFLENLEWFDESGKELVHRLPEKGSGEIKWGAQLTVRESQAGIFFYKGKAVEAFGAGRHTLKTGNIPDSYQNRQFTLGHDQSAAGRNVFRQHEGLHQPEMGDP